MMNKWDEIIYNGCWVVLTLYVLSTLAAFARLGPISCAVAFLCACALSLDISLFNIWFFLPAFICHIRTVDLNTGSSAGFFRSIIDSEAMEDVYMLTLGSLGSWIAIFNAAAMMDPEFYTPTNLQKHGTLARYTLISAYWLSIYLGFYDDGAAAAAATALPMHSYDTSMAPETCLEEKAVLPVDV